MPKRRLLGIGDETVYHCISRTTGGDMLWGVQEKEMLRKMLARVADFCGVEVLTYALMDNHFHLLVSIRKDAGEVSDDELLRRYRVLYPESTQHRPHDAEIIAKALRDNTEEGQKFRTELTCRMGDLSEFIKTLKQRFSIWFNRTHGRMGTLWAERFKSVIVEGTAMAAATVAAYIDLNPVRAGLVDDPKDYRFCGYAEAVAGNAKRQSAFRRIYSAESSEAALARYRCLLFGKGAAPKSDGSGSRIDPQKLYEVIQAGGRLPSHELLRLRVRYFTDGAVIGSAQFVSQHISAYCSDHGITSGRRPKTIRGHADEASLHSMRDPKKHSLRAPDL